MQTYSALLESAIRTTLFNTDDPSTLRFDRKKSLKVAPDVPEDIPQNDEEAEREQRTRSRSGIYGQLAGLRVSLGGISELSKSELLAQYSNCMRLSAENKINHKNAFNLPLIDCMNLLLKKKDEQMNNFQVVGCTLDASTKIYASRVDRVHMDGISFAKDLGGRSRDLPTSKNPESGDDDLADDNEKPTKKKKHRKKCVLSKDVSRINVSLDVTEPDPTYVVLSKQFSNCQPTFISFIPQLTIVDDSSRILMDMNRPLLSNKVETIFSKELEVEFECDTDGNGEIVQPQYRDILSRACDAIDYDSLLQASVWNDSLDIDDANENQMVEDLNDPFVEPLAENTVLQGANETCNGILNMDKHDTTWNSVRVIDVGTARLARDLPQERVVDLQEVILKQVQEGNGLEYTYMGLDRILFAGPAHWSRLPIKRVPGKESSTVNGNRKREKKVNYIQFQNVKEVQIPLSRSCTLTTSYIEKTWNTDDVTNPLDLHLDPKSLKRFFNRPLCGVSVSPQHLPRNDPEEDDDDNDVHDYDNSNDSQQYCPLPSLEGDGENNTQCPESNETAVEFHSFHPDETSSNSDAWHMVEPPNKVARIAVPYAQQAKRIDMKVLKAGIWKVLCGVSRNMECDTHISEKHNEIVCDTNKNKDISSGGPVTGELEFSEMVKTVRNLVPSDMEKDLTMPIIFNALLHLANEKVLSLKGLEDHSDIIISQDLEAESFVRKLKERKFV